MVRTERDGLRELMKKAELPEDAVEALEASIDLLEKAKLWGKVTAMSRKIMEELPDGRRLSEILKETAEWKKDGRIDTISEYTLEFLVLLGCWKILEQRYQEKGMPMEIFTASLKDMHYKLMECKEVYGVYGTFVGHWFSGFFDMTRFALGRLQFELQTYPYDKEYTSRGHTVRKGDMVINMHIPSSGPLLPKEAEDAFAQAAEFYKDKFGGGPVVYVMHSWILDVDMVRIIPEGNMKSFARRFDIIEDCKRDVFEDGWRIFGKEWTKKPEELPRRTKLQKAIADYLQQGGRLGDGYGIFVLS
ncbi:MAG: hypothetical protein EOM40_08715 [Clostridia bacterium]|nr:hypothetical protein [Clostridia bacterium]NCC42422.1 hypothetical protein [Clostridia bacterium]